MSNEVNIANLVRIAVEDLEGARILARDNNRNAFYLCSQAAEKLIRAVLSSEKVHAGIKHDLKLMIDMIPNENPIISELRKLERLTTFATSFRYTGYEGRIPKSPEQGQFEEDSEQIDKLLKQLVKHFEIDVPAKNKAAGNIDPIRKPATRN